MYFRCFDFIQTNQDRRDLFTFVSNYVLFLFVSLYLLRFDIALFLSFVNVSFFFLFDEWSLCSPDM